MDQEMSIEEAMQELTAVMEQLEEPSRPLEDSFTLYTRGMELVKLCNEKIDMVEKKLIVLNNEDPVR